MHRLIQHAQTLDGLNRALAQFLPAPLNQHCRIANVKKHSILLQADSAAWHIRLRYQIPQLLDFFKNKSGLHDLREIKLRIEPVARSDGSPTTRRAHLSPSAAASLRNLAQSMSDTGLREALLRLASRRQR